MTDSERISAPDMRPEFQALHDQVRSIAPDLSVLVSAGGNIVVVQRPGALFARVVYRDGERFDLDEAVEAARASPDVLQETV